VIAQPLAKGHEIIPGGCRAIQNWRAIKKLIQIKFADNRIYHNANITFSKIDKSGRCEWYSGKNKFDIV